MRNLIHGRAGYIKFKQDMIFFLERIARLLHEQSGSDLRDHCLVFPSRRAGLYFLKYYSALLDKPAWTPSIMTIGEFFSSFSNLAIADNEILLFELYKVYRKLNPSAESFDEFYFWGDMLINDFDDVDKYLANARALFRNVTDFRDIDRQFEDITPEQAEIIKRFWLNFEPDKFTKEKEGFKSIWSVLADLYTNYRHALRKSGIAYEGMLYRDVAEAVMSGSLPSVKWKNIHFVGFNALNKCELAVMRHLSGKGTARFYWDYDNSYVKNSKVNSAGYFLRQNLEIFGNDMPADWNYDTNLSAPGNETKWDIIETTSDISQVKLIPCLIGRLKEMSPGDAHHTAVILADEKLIVPVLTSLPAGTGDINITMGYPLAMTGVYSLIKHLIELQRSSVSENGSVSYHYRYVIEILRHQLIVNKLTDEEKYLQNEILKRKQILVPSGFLNRSDTTSALFARPGNPAEFSDYLRKIMMIVSAGNGTENHDNMQVKLRNEFVYTVLLTINRLEKIVKSQEVRFSNETYVRILDKVLRTCSVPFSGEPVSGIQIMGFLETRSLDFRNIIMLSVNEGILPSAAMGSSFIPYSLREAFGLPAINHQESIFAYHFYRLLHRAENVTFVYNSDSTGLRTGEMSRFLIQMKYEQSLKPKLVNLSFDIRSAASISHLLEKNDHHLQRLYSMYADNGNGVILSPTAINTWLGCRMRFFYRYVNRLKEPVILTEEIDHAVFGEVLHKVMKSVYAGFMNREVTPGDIDAILKDENRLENLVENLLNGGSEPDAPGYHRGKDIIMRDILLTYLIKILLTDRTLAPFNIEGLEKPVLFMLSINDGSREISLRTGGNIDRIDKKNGETRIVDYKTGGIAEKIASVSELFEDDRKKETDGWLQTLVYCEALLAENTSATIRPSVYNIKELSADKFSDVLKIKAGKNDESVIYDYKTIRNEFLDGLAVTVTKIFSRDEPFRMTESLSKCNYCPYRGLCRR